MSEEMKDNINEEIAQEEQKQEVDYKSLYEQTKNDLDAIIAKKDELLGETKRAKAARQEVLQKMQELEAQKAENMQKNGEFKELWQSEQNRAKELEQQLNAFKQNIRQEKVTNNAMKIANELANGRAENADLLSVFVGQSLNEYADEMGNIDESVVESVIKQFKQDKRYAPLLGGSRATGGGAVGGKPGNPQRSEISRREFDALNAEQKMEFMRKGGKTFDE